MMGSSRDPEIGKRGSQSGSTKIQQGEHNILSREFSRQAALGTPSALLSLGAATPILRLAEAA